MFDRMWIIRQFRASVALFLGRFVALTTASLPLHAADLCRSLATASCGCFQPQYRGQTYTFDRMWIICVSSTIVCESYLQYSTHLFSRSVKLQHLNNIFSVA